MKIANLLTSTRRAPSDIADAPADAARDLSRMSRRGFLTVSGGAAAGLLVGFSGAPQDAAAAATEAASFNPFVRVAPDGTVTVIVKHLDKGQGVLTGLSTLVAEELDADWTMVRAEFAPADGTRYNNLLWGDAQGTGGSTAIANAFMQYREAGAAARAMIVAAAAAEWGVPAGEIEVAQSVLSHPSGKRGGIGDFAAAAALLPAPSDVAVKDPSRFTKIGSEDIRRLDTVAKTDGTATYTQDIQLDGMLVAVIARPPKFGGTVEAFDDTAARAVPGVVDVVQVPQGVAVLAKNTWTAMQGRNALDVTWDFSEAETRSTDLIFSEYRAALGSSGDVAAEHGDTEVALEEAAQVIEEAFEFPFLAHTPMEPMNAVADLKPGQSLDVYTGSQIQTVDHFTAAAIAELDPANVRIHTQLAGGSFGRRATPDADMVSEAVAVAVAIEGRAPVKVVWSREDDVKGGKYRPAYVHEVKIGLDAAGKIIGWHHHVVGQSILIGTPFEEMLVSDGIDATSVEGANELYYAVPNHRLELTTTDVTVPVLWWRAVGSTHTAYVVETMIDRAAAAAGVDPVEYRLAMLADHPRHAAVLRLAAEKAGWGEPTPEGVTRGVALHKSFNSYVAQIADVRMREDGTVKVERVVCAVDCGVAVNPDQIRAQMEGGIGFGLGAILREEITLTDGEVDQEQFYDYEPLRIDEMPVIETHIVASAEAPTGVGEPGTPVIGPAVANAVHAATGRVPTSLPLRNAGFA